MDRRTFLAGTTGVAGFPAVPVLPSDARAPVPTAGEDRTDRETWVRLARQLADPVLTNLAPAR